MILLSFVIAHCWSTDIYWSTESFDIVFLLNLFLISIYYWCYRVYRLIHTVAVHQISVLSIISFILVTALTKPWSTWFSCTIPLAWHSRQHWSDLLEMNGLITSSERRRNIVWHGDEWNWGLGLRKPLTQIEGINDCSTARGPQWLTLFLGTMAV